ncbi:uncharacterized protein LOC130951865 isoform X1 [Arachis stenosperma]|uniref:uncharacterized protein LOC130951865 isoform X1 n=1 Tax=Arachis stenosperma TaxID=217475 RepID=UPI0025AD638B|nr:uncharacterized protein LOC130951865 isoform X1 [Arachis stenosperma]
MKNSSMSCFLFVLLFTFLLFIQVLTQKISNNEERIPAHSNVAWPNELEDGSTSGSIGYHLPHYYFQEANPSLVPNAEKGHYTTPLVGYTPSDYQLDKTMIGIKFPGGSINFPWPFSSSMFVAPKNEASPLYTSTSYYPANQYPSYFGDTEENPENRRMAARNRKFMMEPSEVNRKTSSMIYGGKAYGDIDEETTT